MGRVETATASRRSAGRRWRSWRARSGPMWRWTRFGFARGSSKRSPATPSRRDWSCVDRTELGTEDLMTDNASNGYDVIIVGAGPAGLCAAMYAGRGMLKLLTIERGAPRGELRNNDLIHGYIGF